MPETTTKLAELSAGTQALVKASPHQDLLPLLPDRAFSNLLVVQTSGSPERTERVVRERGFDPARVGVVPVTGSNIGYDGPLWVAERVSPSDLTGLSIQFSNALKYVQEGGWIVFDNVSTLYMYSDPPRLYRLVSTLTKATRQQSATGLYHVTAGAMSDQDVSTLRNAMDELVEL